VIVPVEVDVAVGHRDLHRGIAVKGRSGRRKRGQYVRVVGSDDAKPDEIKKPEVGDVAGEEIALVKVERLRTVRIPRWIDALIVAVTAPVSVGRKRLVGEACSPRICRRLPACGARLVAV
jgi:hypothetical protein